MPLSASGFPGRACMQLIGLNRYAGIDRALEHALPFVFPLLSSRIQLP